MAAKVPGIEQRGRGFYAVRDVPRPLQARLGKRRLVRSLETRDPHVAKARSHAVQAEFQRQIDAAKRDTSASPGVEAGLAWRDTWTALQRDDPATLRQWGGDGMVLDLGGKEVHLSPGEAAGVRLDEQFHLEVEALAEAHGPAEAAAMRGLADGSATPILFYLDGWLAEGGQKGALTDRTGRQYRSDLAALEQWLRTIGIATLEGVTKKAAGRYVSEALLAANVNRVTANRKISAPSAYWKWLMKRGHAEANPWVGQSLSKGADRGQVERTKRPFTDAEMRTLFAGSKLEKDLELADAMRMAALSGMRLEEIYRLTVADCADDWFRIRMSKTPAGRRKVPVHPELVGLVAGRVANKALGDFLFHEAGPAKAGRERSAALSKRFGKYRQAVKVHDRAEGKRHSAVDFHSFRRWFITQARNAGTDEAVVAAVVGHGRPGMTDGVYHGGPTEGLMRECVGAVETP